MSVLQEAHARLPTIRYLDFIIQTGRVWHEYLQQQPFDGSDRSNQLYREYQDNLRAVLNRLRTEKTAA
jgi:hypothetical protein